MTTKAHCVRRAWCTVHNTSHRQKSTGRIIVIRLMSTTAGTKRAAPSDDALEPALKCTRNRTYEGTSNVAPSPLANRGAWRILAQFLKTEMSYSEMEEKLSLYLGDQYSADDWKDAKTTLFSGEDNVGTCLRNLELLRQRYMPRRPRPRKNMYLDIEANEGDSEEEEEEDGDYDTQDQVDSSARSPKVTSIPGPSAKDTLSKKIDEIYNNATKVSSSSRSRISYRAAWSPATLESRMYLLHVHRTATVYIAEYLHGKGFPVTVSPWLPGQLYVVSDSPKTIASSLPASHKLSVKDYHRISDEERVAVEHSTIKFPNPSWVRVKSGMYKGVIGYVFDPDQSDLFVDVLVITRKFPYPMPAGSEALIDHSRLPKDKEVTDIIRNGEIIGCAYKGQRYYRGLLLKKFHRYQLELKSIVAFSKHFLRVEMRLGSSREQYHQRLARHREELEARLEDVERVFWIGDAVRVVAGSYLGLEGHVIQMDKDLFHLCQGVLHGGEIGDYIEVLVGETHGEAGRRDLVFYGGTQLWFQEESPQALTLRPPSFQVPVAFVKWTRLPQTVKFTKEKGISDLEQIDVPIGFVMKILNVSLDSFNNVIGQEVRAPHSNAKTCNQYGMRLNGLMLGESDLIAFCDMRKRSYLALQPRRCITPPPVPLAVSSNSSNSISAAHNPSSSNWTAWNLTQDIDGANLNDPSSGVDLSSSTSDPWTIDAQDIQDGIDARAEQLKDNVSPSFDHAKFHKRFVSSACPDPFCGAALEHYHIPAKYLSPAPPRKKKTRMFHYRWQLLRSDSDYFTM
ncbi:uncharacterized protein F5891DRAFT_986769 [Suillus fuscotomentosus]|uniref:Uncharacterized protein n=1 Tax=Suillus fuscotomentosus TaxID=1912939 RepID=A0AAD4DR88_9AGAM|nr:uncharacterized protein F5891DRAFT_986769 [Suillus fuscotomentosus]KAG1891580.1 hypothetical protein F5891DRAFT_986769 [Suillus fuscotomentosus]